MESPARRLPLSIGVDYRKPYSRRCDKANVKNISLTGAFIQDPEAELQENDRISLTFEIGGRKRKISALIVWTGKHGAGVEFQHSNKQDQQIIDDLMYFVEEKQDDRRSILNKIFDEIA
ncbi:MAG: PilZ domain-containing protein [Bdellovibrionales bacterium]